MPVRALLTCHNLTLRRGDHLICRQLGFSLLEGGILLLAGANGIGKTSLIKSLAGLIRPEEGDIMWRGEAIERSERHAGEALYIGHQDALKEDCSVLENLRFWAAMRDNVLLLPAAIHYFGLQSRLSIPCRELSAGWRRRVALTRLLLNPAALWLLDEPAANLDSEGVALLGGLIESRTRKGGVVVLSAHGSLMGLLPGGAPVIPLDLSDYAG